MAWNKLARACTMPATKTRAREDRHIFLCTYMEALPELGGGCQATRWIKTHSSTTFTVHGRPHVVRFAFASTRKVKVKDRLKVSSCAAAAQAATDSAASELRCPTEQGQTTSGASTPRKHRRSTSRDFSSAHCTSFAET